MQKIGLLRITVLLILFAVLLSGCMGANEEFIQGLWRYQSAHLDEKTSESALIVIWTFENGTFTYDACCFLTDEHIMGRYQIVSSTEDQITLKLTNVDGSASNYEGSQVFIKINRADDTLSINRANPFLRWTP